MLDWTPLVPREQYARLPPVTSSCNTPPLVPYLGAGTSSCASSASESGSRTSRGRIRPPGPCGIRGGI